MKVIGCIILLTFFSACSMVPERSYTSLMDENEPFYVPERDFSIAAGDTGERYQSMEETIARTPASLEAGDRSLSEDLKEKYQLERELAAVESQQPPMFQEMYWQYKDQFRNDSERIYFLTLPSLGEREQYLQSRGMKTQQKPQFMSDLLSKEDHTEILTGMSPMQVRRIHGNPNFIETVSSELNQNRWGYALPNSRVRYIYFEQDRVKGWSEEMYESSRIPASE